MRLGIFQPDCAGADTSTRMQRLGDAIAGENLDIVVCPELFMSGYDVGNDILKLAEPANGAFYKAACDVAGSAGTAICYGYPERDGDTIHNSAAVVAPDGTLLANHRKRANSPGSFEAEYFTAGQSETLIDYKGFRIGVLICFEAEFPEAVRSLALQGAELVLAPTALVDIWDVVASRMIPTRAFENGIWLAYANHAGVENTCSYLGDSRIVAPDGYETALAGAVETLIVSEIDKDRVKKAQARLPYLDHWQTFAPRNWWSEE